MGLNFGLGDLTRLARDRSTIYNAQNLVEGFSYKLRTITFVEVALEFTRATLPDKLRVNGDQHFYISIL
jgi:hypothetical protein